VKDPYLLHIFNPTRNVSPFDVNMAYEAEFDGVIPYTGVRLDEVRALTQDTIFSRSRRSIRRSALFIGGREFMLALDMLEAARDAMVPGFEVSVFADPSGAFTTAAALVTEVERTLAQSAGMALADSRIAIIGGTGPVGLVSGLLAAGEGAEVHVVSHRGRRFAEEAVAVCNARFGFQLQGHDGSSPRALAGLLAEVHVVLATARAGVQVISSEQLAGAGELRVAADVNAVPPLGIEGIAATDHGVPLDAAPRRPPGLGALAVGDAKFNLRRHSSQTIKASAAALFIDHRSAFDLARRA